MKHRVTVEVETRHHFFGIPYTTTEKKDILVDGRTYRKMKHDEKDREAAHEALEGLWEEEMADLYGEDSDEWF